MASEGLPEQAPEAVQRAPQTQQIRKRAVAEQMDAAERAGTPGGIDIVDHEKKHGAGIGAADYGQRRASEQPTTS